MKTVVISATAKLCALSLLAPLVSLSGCVGALEPVASESRSSSQGRDASTRDGGKKRDASTDPGDEPVDPIDLPDDAGSVEVPEPPVVVPDDDASTEDPPVDDPTDAGSEPDTGTPPPACPNGAAPAAKGLKIRQLALYQTVKVALYQSGAWVSSYSVPVVAGKKSLVRVFVDTQSGYSAHPVRGVLTLTNSQGTTALQDQRTISASSTDESDTSTFSFNVDPDQITGDTQLSLSLEEPDCNAAAGTANDVKLSHALGATQIGKLKVVILPINIGGTLPNTSAGELAKITAALLAYYPVAAVDVSVRATPFVGPSSLSPSDSNAWGTVLNSVLKERSNDRAPSDTYYFGLMQPAATFNTFCRSGCILGIAPQNTRISASAQGGLGAYFSDNQSGETIVHELGHAHGRGHAPCVKGSGTIQGVDTSFPDKTGGISEWGWDSRSSKLISPATYKDIMGYCSPNWISPYTYGAIATRSMAVNSLLYVKQADMPQTWTNALLYDNGTARWGGAYETSMPGGEIETASVLDASGRVIETIEVTRLELSHTDTAILYFPTPGANWASLALHDRTLQLSDLLPEI